MLIVDAATGKYIGHFGAYGQNPVVGENGGDDGEGVGSWAGDFRKGALKPTFFRSPLHCAKLANDGLLYVCDRGNNRVQIFRASEAGKPCANPNGEVGKCGFVGEMPVAPQTASGTSGAVSLSTDGKQTCLYVADLTNDTIYVVNRQNLPGAVARRHGRAPGGQPALAARRQHRHAKATSTPARWMAPAACRSSCATVRPSCTGTGSAEVGRYKAAAR